MTIHWAGTEMDVIGGFHATTTNSAYFDINYSVSALLGADGLGPTVSFDSPIGAGTLWSAQALVHIPYIVKYGYNSYRWSGIKVYDESGGLLGGVYSTNNMYSTLYLVIYIKTASSSATVDIGFVAIENTKTVMTLIGYQEDENAVLEFYINNGLKGRVRCAGTLIGMKSVSFYGGDSRLNLYNELTKWYSGISEIVVADESTLGMRVKTYRPIADGFHQTWDGNYDNVNNLTVGIDAISTQLANAAETFLHGASLNEGTAIRALCVGAAAASEDPAGARGVIYSDGTLHQQAFVKPLSQGAPPNVAILETNPATGLAWTPAEFNALEFGVQHT